MCEVPWNCAPERELRKYSISMKFFAGLNDLLCSDKGCSERGGEKMIRAQRTKGASVTRCSRDSGCSVPWNCFQDSRRTQFHEIIFQRGKYLENILSPWNWSQDSTIYCVRTKGAPCSDKGSARNIISWQKYTSIFWTSKFRELMTRIRQMGTPTFL